MAAAAIVKDRRILKTRKLLQGALIALMLEKKYEDFAVKEILDRANVGRSTFYAHFRDKDDLLMSGFHDLRDALREAQAAAVPVRAKPHERFFAFALPLFEHVAGHRQVYKATLGSSARAMILEHFQSIVVELITDELKKLLEWRRRGTADIPADLLVHYLAGTFNSVVCWWLEQKSPLEPRRVNELFRTIVLPTLAGTFAVAPAQRAV